MVSPPADCSEEMLAVHALLGQIHSRLDTLCCPVTHQLEDACQHMQPAAAKTMSSIAAVHSIHRQSVCQQARTEATHQHPNDSPHAATTTTPKAAQITSPSATSPSHNLISRSSTKPSDAQTTTSSLSTTLFTADDGLMPEIFQQLTISIEELTKSVAAIAGATDDAAGPMQYASEPSFSWQAATTHSPSTTADQKPGSTGFDSSSEQQQRPDLTVAAAAVVFDTSSTRADCTAAEVGMSVPTAGDTEDSTAASSSCSLPLPSRTANPSSVQEAAYGSYFRTNCSSIATAPPTDSSHSKYQQDTTAAAAGAEAYPIAAVMYQSNNTEPPAAGSAALGSFLITGRESPNRPGQCVGAAGTTLAQPMQITAEAADGVATLPSDSDQPSASTASADQVPAAAFFTRHKAVMAVAGRAEAAVTGQEPAPPADTAQETAVVSEAFDADGSSCSSMPLHQISSEQSATEQPGAATLNTCSTSNGSDGLATAMISGYSSSRGTATAAAPALQTPADASFLQVPAAVGAAAGTGCNSSSSSDNREVLQDSVGGPLQLSRMALAARHLLKGRQARARPLGWQQPAAMGAAAPLQSQPQSSGRNTHAGASAVESSASVEDIGLSDATAAGRWAEDTSAADDCCNTSGHQDSMTEDKKPGSSKAIDQPSSSSRRQPQHTQPQLAGDRPSSRSSGRGSLIEAAAALVLAGSSVKEVAAAAAAAARSAEASATVLSEGCSRGCRNPARSSSSAQQQLLATAPPMIVSILASPEKGARLRVGECELNQQSNKACQGDQYLQWRQQQQQERPARLRHRQKSVATTSSGKRLPTLQLQQQEQQNGRDQQQQQRLCIQQTSRGLSTCHQAAASATSGMVQRGTGIRSNSITGKSVSHCKKDQNLQQQRQQQQLFSTAAGLPGPAKAAASPAGNGTGIDIRIVDSDSSSDVGSSRCGTPCKPLGVVAADNGIKGSWLQGRWKRSPNMLDRARKLGLATVVDGSPGGRASACRRLALGPNTGGTMYLIDSSSEDDM